jgi:hypothetical protein
VEKISFTVWRNSSGVAERSDSAAESFLAETISSKLGSVAMVRIEAWPNYAAHGSEFQARIA